MDQHLDRLVRQDLKVRQVPLVPSVLLDQLVRLVPKAPKETKATLVLLVQQVLLVLKGRRARRATKVRPAPRVQLAKMEHLVRRVKLAKLVQQERLVPLEPLEPLEPLVLVVRQDLQVHKAKMVLEEPPEQLVPQAKAVGLGQHLPGTIPLTMSSNCKPRPLARPWVRLQVGCSQSRTIAVLASPVTTLATA
jgi:hypothetical protein